MNPTETPNTPNAPTGLIAKAMSLGRALKSVFDDGFASPELQRVRLNLCTEVGGSYCDTCSQYLEDCECDEPNTIEEPCPFLNLKSGLHCTKCGCDQRSKATDLRAKAVMPKIDCPRNLWPQQELNNG